MWRLPPQILPLRGGRSLMGKRPDVARKSASSILVGHPNTRKQPLLEGERLDDRIIFAKKPDEYDLFRQAEKGDILNYEGRTYLVLDIYKGQTAVLLREFKNIKLHFHGERVFNNLLFKNVDTSGWPLP